MNLDEIENMGDGYHKEYQRAVAVSKMLPAPDQEDRNLANWAVANGYCVAVELTPRYCSFTDAVIGDHLHVIFMDGSRLKCVEQANCYQADPDGRIEIWPRAVAVPVVPQIDDGVPF
jgi:hypothetical protein